MTLRCWAPEAGTSVQNSPNLNQAIGSKSSHLTPQLSTFTFTYFQHPWTFCPLHYQSPASHDFPRLNPDFLQKWEISWYFFAFLQISFFSIELLVGFSYIERTFGWFEITKSGVKDSGEGFGRQIENWESSPPLQNAKSIPSPGCTHFLALQTLASYSQMKWNVYTQSWSMQDWIQNLRMSFLVTHFHTNLNNAHTLGVSPTKRSEGEGVNRELCPYSINESLPYKWAELLRILSLWTFKRQACSHWSMVSGFKFTLQDEQQDELCTESWTVSVMPSPTMFPLFDLILKKYKSVF